MEQSLAFKLCGACKAKLGLDVLAVRTDGLGRQAKLRSNVARGPAGADQQEDLHFPIVTGLSESMPREEREKRMATYTEFMKDIDLVRPGSTERVSEIELGNPRDLRAVLTGLGGGQDPQAVTVHFGRDDFTGKYRMLVENFAQWQANAGTVQSIDLQYSRQVVVNPDNSIFAAKKKR